MSSLKKKNREINHKQSTWTYIRVFYPRMTGEFVCGEVIEWMTDRFPPVADRETTPVVGLRCWPVLASDPRWPQLTVTGDSANMATTKYVVTKPIDIGERSDDVLNDVIIIARWSWPRTAVLNLFLSNCQTITEQNAVDIHSNLRCLLDDAEPIVRTASATLNSQHFDE